MGIVYRGFHDCSALGTVDVTGWLTSCDCIRVHC